LSGRKKPRRSTLTLCLKNTHEMKIIRVVENPIYDFPCFIASPRGRGVEYQNIPLINIMADYLPAGLDAIIAGSDFQARDRPAEDGKLIGFAISEELKVLSECQALPPSENTGVMLAGDFFCAPGLGRRGGSGDVQDVWRAFGDAFGWVVGVAGNHDRFCGMHEIPDPVHCPVSASVLDGDICERNSLSVGGISGIVGNPRKRWRKSEDIFIRKIDELTAKPSDILILHEGPSVPEIGAEGNDSIRARLNSVRNDMIVVSGHTHWSRVFYQLNENVQAINVDFRVVIITEKEIDAI